MARLSRKLRICKWVSTIAGALVGAALVGSGCWELRFERTKEWRWTVIDVSGGVCFFFRTPNTMPISLYPVRPSPGSWSCRLSPRDRSSWRLSRGDLLPRVDCSYEEDDYDVDLPLWLPLVVLLVPTVWLWRRDRPRPGFCRVCDYDLTGNTTGCCPECGTACEPAPEQPVPPAA